MKYLLDSKNETAAVSGGGARGEGGRGWVTPLGPREATPEFLQAAGIAAIPPIPGAPLIALIHSGRLPGYGAFPAVAQNNIMEYQGLP